jgi:hypothetical protein
MECNTGRHCRSGQIQTRGRPSEREKYTEEEAFFIWYHRVDLSLDWRVVLACFNTQFPHRQRSKIHSLQCALSRFIKRRDCPPFRKQELILNEELQSEHYSTRQYERALRFGVLASTRDVWYPGCKRAGSVCDPRAKPKMLITSSRRDQRSQVSLRDLDANCEADMDAIYTLVSLASSVQRFAFRKDTHMSRYKM